MSTLGEANGQLDIGRVIQEMFGVLGRNFVTFLVLSLILVGAPAVIYGYLQLTFVPAGVGFSWQSTVGGLVSGLMGLILQGTIIYGTVTDLNGKRASLGQCLSVGLASFLPLLGIGILFYIALFFSFILLIVPGLMLLTAWIVCVPVYVAERPGLLAVFGRSAELTRGNRWRIFALLILVVVALIIVEALSGMLGSATRIAAGQPMSMMQALVVTPLVGVASGLLTTTGTAALYVELRRVRDGVGPAGLAAIFD